MSESQVSEATQANPVAAADLGLPAPAPAPAPVAERVVAPELPGLAFLGLPPLPALTTQERSVSDGGPGALPPMPEAGAQVRVMFFFYFLFLCPELGATWNFCRRLMAASLSIGKKLTDLAFTASRQEFFPFRK